MTRLLDLCLDCLQTIIMDMAKLSEQSVFTSIEAYDNGKNPLNISHWQKKHIKSYNAADYIFLLFYSVKSFLPR